MYNVDVHNENSTVIEIIITQHKIPMQPSRAGYVYIDLDSVNIYIWNTTL